VQRLDLFVGAGRAARWRGEQPGRGTQPAGFNRARTRLHKRKIRFPPGTIGIATIQLGNADCNFGSCRIKGDAPFVKLALWLVAGVCNAPKQTVLILPYKFDLIREAAA
jgi:hypothetical protein